MRKQGKTINKPFTPAPDGGRGVIGPGQAPSQPQDSKTNPPRQPPKK